MDWNQIGAIVGIPAGIATIIVAIVTIRNHYRTEKENLSRAKGEGTLIGMIDQLVGPNEEAAKTASLFKRKLPTAKKVRMCGYSLIGIITESRDEIRDLIRRGYDIRILLLDPEAKAVRDLDSIVTDIDIWELKARSWPSRGSKGIVKHDLDRSIGILKGSGVIKDGFESRDILHLCNTLLPFGLLMVENEDGSGWASVQIYPLHPDVLDKQRLFFTLGNNKTKLWQVLSEQFDFAWEDPCFSHPFKEQEADKVQRE